MRLYDKNYFFIFGLVKLKTRQEVFLARFLPSTRKRTKTNGLYISYDKHNKSQRLITIFLSTKSQPT